MRLRLWIALVIALGVGIGATNSSYAASFKVLHTFNSQTDGASPWGDLIFDKAGNLYGTTVSDTVGLRRSSVLLRP